MSKPRHILLFPGSYNPLHIGHIGLANYVIETNPQFDELWLMLTPKNPFKQKDNLLDDTLRKEWASSIIGQHQKIHLRCDEFNLPAPHYTFNTIEYLRKTYQNVKFSLMIGMDSLIGLPKWYRGKELLEQNDIYVYPRLGYKEPEDAQHYQRVHLIDAPLIEISSTMVRHMIQHGHDVPYLIGSRDSSLYNKLKLAIKALPINID